MASFKISAPYALPKTTSQLPEPEFGDTNATDASVDVKRTMTGRVVTYVTSSTKRRLTYRFSLTRQKQIELCEFIRIFKGVEWKLEDHDGTIWKAQLLGQSIRNRGVGRQAPTVGTTGGEEYDATLRFLAEKIS